MALEYGATVLSIELAHMQSLAEVELRLRRDIVEDLLSGHGRTQRGPARPRAAVRPRPAT